MVEFFWYLNFSALFFELVHTLDSLGDGFFWLGIDVRIDSVGVSCKLAEDAVLEFGNDDFSLCVTVRLTIYRNGATGCGANTDGEYLNVGLFSGGGYFIDFI